MPIFIPQKSYEKMPSVRDSRGKLLIFYKQQYSFRNSTEVRLQRLFSTFPAGLPGLGLLLLRAALGITMLFQVTVYFSVQSVSSLWTFFAGIFVIVCSVLILLGFLTPVIGAFLFLGGLIATIFSFPVPVQTVIYEIILSVAVVLLVPGAFSVDAKLFGRREIVIPKN